MLFNDAATLNEFSSMNIKFNGKDVTAIATMSGLTFLQEPSPTAIEYLNSTEWFDRAIKEPGRLIYTTPKDQPSVLIESKAATVHGIPYAVFATVMPRDPNPFEAIIEDLRDFETEPVELPRDNLKPRYYLTDENGFIFDSNVQESKDAFIGDVEHLLLKQMLKMKIMEEMKVQDLNADCWSWQQSWKVDSDVKMSMNLKKLPCAKTAKLYLINNYHLAIQDDLAVKLAIDCNNCEIKPSKSVQWKIQAVPNTNLYLITLNDQECICKDEVNKKPATFSSKRQLNWKEEKIETMAQICSQIGVDLPEPNRWCFNYSPYEQEIFGADFADRIPEEE